MNSSLTTMKELMVVELRKVKDMYEGELRKMREERDAARLQVQQACELREQEIRKVVEEKERKLVKAMTDQIEPATQETAIESTSQVDNTTRKRDRNISPKRDAPNDTPKVCQLS